ncbi:MAG: DUF1565 domain-containing protein [Planctomycetes bacterium]|nr:DUF1565 domain-containing protein [Planctomycetota bacterium]
MKKSATERAARRAHTERRMWCLARTLGVVFASAAPALAGDWYVDASSGDDLNGGTHPRDAWKTITHALAATPTPPAGETQTIHVAPGTYDQALGEVFPLQPRDALVVVGDAGLTETVIAGPGSGTLVSAFVGHFGGFYTGPLTVWRGLRFEGADYGVSVQSSSSVQYLRLEHCRILGMNVAGLTTSGGCSWGCGTTDVALLDVEIKDCVEGLLVSNAAASAPAKLELVESRVVGSFGDGIRVLDEGGGIEVTLVRSQLAANGNDALAVLHDVQVTSNVTHVAIADSLIAFNAGKGIRAELVRDNITNSAIQLDIVRTTIADNHDGIEAFAPTGWSPDIFVTLRDGIVFSYFDDLNENPAHPAFTTVAYCDIADGDFAGTNGNFAANPLFVDPSNFDYRLRWASPCIEAGDPAGVAGGLDLAGSVRPIDGDLDTQERFDVGAFEFAPLFLQSTGELGSPLALELWGPQGNATTVYFARKPLVAPQTTPFGELDLDPAFMSVFRVTTVGSGPPKTIKRTIPNDPAFAGLVFSFQALTTCAAAPLGQAYTNAVELTLVP